MSTWTKDSPTKPGYYWLRTYWDGDERPFEHRVVVEVAVTVDGPSYRHFGEHGYEGTTSHATDNQYCKYAWSPIEEPSEA